MPRPLDSSPDSFGAHKYSCFPHTGPTVYVQLTSVSPPADATVGGDTVQAVEAGMKLFDIVLGSLSDSGFFFVRSIPVSKSDSLAGSQQPTDKLVWYLESSGAEVAAGFNLSNETVRLVAWGTK